MSEAVFRCNRCKDGKLYNSDGAFKHREEHEKKGEKDISFRLLKERKK